MKFMKWYFSPALFAAAAIALFAAWLAFEPAAIRAFFDDGGRSPFELATIPVFLVIIPAVWIARPFTGPKKRVALLCGAVSVVAAMAVVKELDLHNAALHFLFPETVAADGHLAPGLFKPNGAPLSGTPFKMRVLTNPGVPFGMKCAIVFYFAAFFGVFAALLAYFAKDFAAGVFRLDPVAWSVGCLGGAGVAVQIFDRLPAWWCHSQGIEKEACDERFLSLCTCFEEGLEMALAAFAIVAIFQGAAKKRRGSVQTGKAFHE